MTDTLQKIRKLILGLSTAHVAADRIVLEADLVADLELDSLDTVELVMTAEDAFDIEINDDQAAECRTVGQLVDLVDRLVAERVPA